MKMNALKLSAWSVGIMALQLLVGDVMFYAFGGDFVSSAVVSTAIAAVAVVVAFIAFAVFGVVFAAFSIAIGVVFAPVGVAFAITAAIAVAHVGVAFTASVAVGVIFTAVAAAIAVDEKKAGVQEPFSALFFAALPVTNIIVLAARLLDKLRSRSALT